jgi:predicted DNA-binding protein
MAVKQIRWNLFLPPELLEQAKELAARKGVAASDVVRTALEKYLAAVKRAEEAKNAAK